MLDVLTIAIFGGVYILLTRYTFCRDGACRPERHPRAAEYRRRPTSASDAFAPRECQRNGR